LVLRVSNTINIDRIAANVATAGSAGAVIRLGIYRLNDNGSGFTLIVDAGTSDAATTGLKDIVISETLTPGAYFVGAASQGDALTAPVMRTKGSIDGVVQTNAAANHITTINGYRFFGVTGALPATLCFGVCQLSAFLSVEDCIMKQINITYGVGGYDPTKPNNNVIEAYEVESARPWNQRPRSASLSWKRRCDTVTLALLEVLA
jgi:hypothetical protein